MSRDCSTCIKAKEGRCLLGNEAEIYCMGGDFELWTDGKEVLENVVIPDKEIDIMEVARKNGIIDDQVENEKVFDIPEQPYAGVFSQDIVVAIQEICNIDIKQLEQAIGRGLSDEEIASFNEIKTNALKYVKLLDEGKITEDQLREHFTSIAAFSEALANRPKTADEGFNAVKKNGPGDIKSYSCEGCIHFSLVGCFLGRYYDCVDSGRYLFDAGNVVSSIEKTEEVSVDKEDMDYIDSLLDSNKKKEQ